MKFQLVLCSLYEKADVWYVSCQIEHFSVDSNIEFDESLQTFMLSTLLHVKFITCESKISD
jgi:hypothetical protein